MTLVVFHATCKIVGFTATDDQEIPTLISGDNFLMCEQDARHLQNEGAGYIRQTPIKDVARFIPASQIGRGER